MPANNKRKVERRQRVELVGTKPSDKPTPEPPAWPVFKPLAPSSDLCFNILVPNQLVTISNFWTSSLCKTYVSFLSSLPLVTTPGRPKKGEAVRFNDRFQVEDAVFAERLWRDTALSEMVSAVENPLELWGGEVLGLNPNIRIYRYSQGQFFDKHYDDSVNISLPTSPTIQAKTTWTMLLYLTSPSTGCSGGETVFYPEDGPKKAKNRKPEDTAPTTVTLETGMALLHRHGADCMLHEAREVQKGEKWVIRSDLCVRR
ncbi:MAG: hypothetical protein M1821_007431 [Bathelium mastoideum]|nr:MAG: hypothetical protein M1821_007431 [Bathelium mastoideum]KAI9694935.1 MAG: hypothetical protein M1822_000552 [Bathelium mastoideum]